LRYWRRATTSASNTLLVPSAEDAFERRLLVASKSAGVTVMPGCDDVRLIRLGCARNGAMFEAAVVCVVDGIAVPDCGRSGVAVPRPRNLRMCRERLARGAMVAIGASGLRVRGARSKPMRRSVRASPDVSAQPDHRRACLRPVGRRRGGRGRGPAGCVPVTQCRRDEVVRPEGTSVLCSRAVNTAFAANSAEDSEFVGTADDTVNTVGAIDGGARSR
jgi:hypothetical protein